MAMYKAKKSYLKLKDTENFDGIGSPSKHGMLVAGHTLDLEDIPEKIKPHLQEIVKKTTKKEKNTVSVSGSIKTVN